MYAYAPKPLHPPLTPSQPRQTTDLAPSPGATMPLGLLQYNPTPLQHATQPCGLTGVVQRARGPKRRKNEIVQNKKGEWYSVYDPYTIFTTQIAARDYGRVLMASGRKKLYARTPTLYTYAKTKPGNKITNTPQGPHTVAHRVAITALRNASTVNDLKRIFRKYVVSPAKIKSILRDEAPPSGYNATMSERFGRYQEDYIKTYNKIKKEFTEGAPDLILIKDMLNYLLNMDPFATSVWKTTTPASQKKIKPKGENVQDPTFQDLYDRPTPSFNSSNEYKKFLKNRENMFNDNF